MEGISALMDGELDERDAQRELARLKDDHEQRERWERFHLIGDALRGERILSARVTEAVGRRLAEEPTVLAPRRSVRRARRVATYTLSAAASLCAVAFVAWVALSPTTPFTLQAGLKPAAPEAAPAVAPVSLPNVASEGRMNEYILAHQGFSPSTAIQGLAPYIRSVSAKRAPEAR